MANLEERSMLIDPIITPFGNGMKLDGFTPALSSSGCLILRECPSCRGSYSTKYERDGLVYWGCPHCNKIVENK